MAAVAALCGTLASGGLSPAWAQASSQAGSQADSAASDKAAAKPVDQAEARIREMHAKLHITQAQEPQWNDVVQVMRENATQLSQLIQSRDQNIKTASALDDLKAYERIADAHAAGMKKLVAAFQTLYGALSDEQRKAADTLFRTHATQRTAAR